MKILEIKITKRQELKPKQDESKLTFGTEFTDHMFMMDYSKGKGWHDARILPYGDLKISPAATVLHYAVETFEGMKAYKTPDGSIQFFRPMENFARLNRSNKRMCVPEMDSEFLLKALRTLVDIDQDWVPSAPGTALYIRPFIFATDPYIGVRISDHYTMVIILSPVGAYYSTGLQPTRMHVEDVYARTVRGGTGEAKCGGNYAGGLAAQEKAHNKGFEQILWLDGAERKYIEEVGTSNIFFKIDDEFWTPELTGTILPGITRKSVIELLRSWGETVKEVHISIDEFVDLYHQGQVKEVFGTGTAAVVSPIGSLEYMGENMVYNNGEIGEYAQKIYDTLFGIQSGTCEDSFGWTVKLYEDSTK